MIEIKVKVLSLMVIFGALAIVLSFIYIPLPPFGDVTPASTPVSIISTIAPSSVGAAVSLMKGLGISLWTGKWFMEIPVGIGDAIMAVFTHYLTKKYVKPRYAVIVGQLSRYLFTSGIVAFYISSVVSLGVPSLLGGDVIAKFTGYAKNTGFVPASQPFLLCMMIVWLARLPSTTLSILVNALISFFVIGSAEKQLRTFTQLFIRD